MKIIIKIGGSILFDGGEIDVRIIETWIRVINDIRGRGIELGIVIGGGVFARKYISASKELGSSAAFQDLLGIETAKQNARLFISAFPDSCPIPPSNYEDLIAVVGKYDLIFCGGFQPGQSTNAVAAIFAEHLGADYLFNATKVDKVYDSDPAINSNATPIDSMTYVEFAEITERNSQDPGKYALFDHIGLSLVSRSKIPLIFIDGKSPQYILDILDGKKRGTIVADQ